jgi:hypothetical protein
MPEARAPRGNKLSVVFFDDAVDFVKLMLFESFISTQANRLQPEFTAMTALFNVNVRRLKFIREVKMKPKSIFSQDGWHCF